MSERSAFRLRRLLDLRRRQEEQARVQLADSLRQVAELSDEVRARSEALDAVLGGGTPTRSQTTEAIADAASLAIAAAKAAEASARATADEIRRTWERAVVRVDGLERLEEKAAEVARVEERRAESHVVDEAVATRAHQEDDDR